MHGIGNYARYWDLFADAVGGRLHLVAPDARGHGDSPRPATGYTPADFVGDAIRVPGLIVRGRRSTSFSAATAHEMLEALPQAALIELDAAHNVALDQPNALADAVVEFAIS